MDLRRIRPVNLRQFFWRVSPVDLLTIKSVERSLFVSIHSRQYVDRARLVSKGQVCACWGDSRRGYGRVCIELWLISLGSHGLQWSHLIKLIDIRICAIDEVHETLVRDDD